MIDLGCQWLKPDTNDCILNVGDSVKAQGGSKT